MQLISEVARLQPRRSDSRASARSAAAVGGWGRRRQAGPTSAVGWETLLLVAESRSRFLHLKNGDNDATHLAQTRSEIKVLQMTHAASRTSFSGYEDARSPWLRISV